MDFRQIVLKESCCLSYRKIFVMKKKKKEEKEKECSMCVDQRTFSTSQLFDDKRES